jgi:peptidoglycan/xylan/chitin deacetylase (PgdA/CDA1 family)
MIKIEEHLLKMIGRYPLYMRPPFLETDARILGYLRDLDYKVISRDVETNDWMRNPPSSMAAFRKALDNGGRLILAHEPIDETINIILPKMIEEVKKRGLKGELSSIYRLCAKGFIAD